MLLQMDNTHLILGQKVLAFLQLLGVVWKSVLVPFHRGTLGRVTPPTSAGLYSGPTAVFSAPRNLSREGLSFEFQKNRLVLQEH